MKPEQDLPVDTVVRVAYWTSSQAEAGDAVDGAFRELSKRWPDTVDLAEQPGLLNRLDATLNV